MKKVDLHLHSYASDGEWSPEEILQQVDDHQLKIFAVCDHDVVDCVPRMMDLVKDRQDLEYIPGVEASVLYKGREVHILTYYIDPSDERLLKLLQKNNDYRENSNMCLMEYLGEQYPEVSLEGYHAYKYDPYQGGWKAYMYLKDLGLADNIKEYFSKAKGFKVEKDFVSIEDYISKVRDMGYVPVLAHPPAYAEGDLYDIEDLDYLRSLGLGGIECYTQYLADPKNSQYYVDYCNKYDLLITGGSDCHGAFAGRAIGRPTVYEHMIRLRQK